MSPRNLYGRPTSASSPAADDGNGAPVRRRRRRRADETEPARNAELLQLAATMFSERGYDATSVSDIGTALGITKGSVYHYIDSKEDLLYQVCKAAHDDARPVIDHVEAMHGSALERLEYFLRETAASNARNVTYIAVYYRDLRRLTGDRRASIAVERRRYDRLLVRLIDEGKHAGEIDPDVPTRVMAANLLAQVIWFYTWYRKETGPSPEELGAYVARLALSGIVTGRRRPRRRTATANS